MKSSEDARENFPHDDISASVWHTLNYFDVFSHPLMLHEVAACINRRGVDESEVRNSIERLISDGLVSECQGYYYLGNDKSKIKRRIEGNILACTKMRKARFYSRVISLFPYTRAVMISGSLSKGVMYPDSDIDFFIITRKGRLWFNRTLLAMFKKIFLLNSHKNFCINYFIDEEHLPIPDRNVFTATEIAFLMPMVNYPLHHSFIEANAWYSEHYPNMSPVVHPPDKQPGFRAIFEMPFNNRFGDWIERQCMKINNRYWSKKFKNCDFSRPESDIYSTSYTSKYHPNRQQFKVLQQLEEKLAANGGEGAVMRSGSEAE